MTWSSSGSQSAKSRIRVDGYDLFLTLVLYPTFGWEEPAYHLEPEEWNGEL
jgi:hypothetical protein